MLDRDGAPRVLVFPGRMSNRYLKLLHQAPADAGIEMLPARLKHLDSDGDLLRRGDVFHIHWTQPIAQDRDSEDEAWASVAAFMRFVERMRSTGVRVVWTVHNHLPHQMRYLEPELELCQFIADRADRIHIRSVETPQAVEDLYHLPPERLKYIPHPSYQGVHDASVSRGRAKEMLGLAHDEATVLYFGRMQAYKGVDTLLEAIALMNERGTTAPTLLLAGRPKPSAEQVRIEEMLPTGSRVVTHFEFVDDEDIPTWFGAADVAVFPFRTILNSGTVHLAATLGVPVVLPGEPHLRSQFRDEPWVRFFDPEAAAASLADVLAHPDETDHSGSMARFSDRVAPEKVSQQYLDLLRELMLVSPGEKAGTGVRRVASAVSRRLRRK